MKWGAAATGLVWLAVLGLAAFIIHQLSSGKRIEEELRAAIARLTAEDRMATIHVLAVERDRDTGRKRAVLRWEEHGPHPDGRRLPARELVVAGDEVRFEALQIVFESEHVREGDPLRGKSLFLFRRAYGQHEAPEAGVRLDVPEGALEGKEGVPEGDPVPPWYRLAGGESGAFQERLWRGFWRLATDQEAARQQGIRSAQGIAVWKPLVEGKRYELTLTASGQLLLDGPLEPETPPAPGR